MNRFNGSVVAAGRAVSHDGGTESIAVPGHLVNPNDLRGILNYIPRYRGENFVVCVDGAIVSHENFANVLLDIAVLRSLNIRIVLVHGAAHQISLLASERNVTPSDRTGEGTTDEWTLELAMTAGNRVAHEILEGLAARDLRAAVTNAIQARPMGIIRGSDRKHTGKVDKIDVPLLKDLLDRGVIPVVPPLAFDGNGRTYRISSDALAVAAARALGAVKLVFLVPQDGILDQGKLIREIPGPALARRLSDEGEAGSLTPLDKARHAVEACEGGVLRVHVINGTTRKGLLSEIFSTRGIGTLVHANNYQKIRKARKGDLPVLLSLTRDSMDAEELSSRTMQQLEDDLDDYMVYEEDRQVIGCVALHAWPRERMGELALLCVETSRMNRGVGLKLVHYVEKRARQSGLDSLFLLSTQSFTYFQDKAGFREGSPADLPEDRRDSLERSGRNSRILVKSLGRRDRKSMRET